MLLTCASEVNAVHLGENRWRMRLGRTHWWKEIQAQRWTDLEFEKNDSQKQFQLCARERCFFLLLSFTPLLYFCYIVHIISSASGTDPGPVHCFKLEFYFHFNVTDPHANFEVGACSGLRCHPIAQRQESNERKQAEGFYSSERNSFFHHTEMQQ